MRTVLLLLCVLLPSLPDTAAAQQDSVALRPGPQYEAGTLTRWLLGTGYRPLWAAPLRVEVLDLAGFAGGLEPIERGGGNQTRTLHMRGADGRRYIFRSVDKDVERVLPADLRRTFVHRLFQDHMSALHPTGALAVPPTLEAVGVLHVAPQLFVMPDDPRLGEHRAEFAGMLGQIEERPNEGPDETPGFAGSSRVVGTERLLERLDEDPEQVVSGREYLAARLIDFVIGDTDRGSDQWRWAGEDRAGGGLLFRPIPRDRDWAFLRSEGPLSRFVGSLFPKLVTYGPSYPSVRALTYASIHRDRQLLAELPREMWDSVADAVQASLTDDVIARAVGRLPPEHRTLEAERMASALRARRAKLPDVAADFYRYVAGEVDVRGTLGGDRAVLDLGSDGIVEVRVSSASSPGTPFYQRQFLPDETREIRLYLLDGDDRAVVRGAGPTPIAVRIVGGAGDDVLADSSARGAAMVGLYDAAGENVIAAGPGTRVDGAAFEPPPPDGDWIAAKVARERFRDWGRSSSIGPVADYGEGAGVIAGARWNRTAYGFRHTPHAHRLWLEGTYALASGGFGLEAGAHRTRENSPWSVSLRAAAEQYDANRFYGFGNDSPPIEAADPGSTLVMQDRALLTPALTMAPSLATSLSLGLRGLYVDPRPEPGSPLAESGAVGSEAYGSAGAWAEAELDRSAGEGLRRSGYSIGAAAAVHPVAWHAPGWFGTAEAEARAYLGRGPTLAFRAGGRKAMGSFPVQHAAFIGGKNSLRGFRYNRFAGDGALYGSTEARAPLGRVLLLLRGELGLIAFVDAGRVFVDGASPGGWHTGFGGGVTFTTLGTTLTASYARGEENRFYLDLGAPF